MPKPQQLNPAAQQALAEGYHKMRDGQTAETKMVSVDDELIDHIRAEIGEPDDETETALEIMALEACKRIESWRSDYDAMFEDWQAAIRLQSEAGAEAERLADISADMLAALKRIEPSIGWRGKPADDLESDLHHCEFCAGSAAIATDVPHHEDCPIYAIRAAIARAEPRTSTGG